MKRAATGIPAGCCSPAQKARTSAHPLHPGGSAPSTTELAMQFQELCMQAAIKDGAPAGHWRINGVILRIYNLHEIQRIMTEAELRHMIQFITAYLGTTNAVPRPHQS